MVFLTEADGIGPLYPIDALTMIFFAIQPIWLLLNGQSVGVYSECL